MNKNYGAKDNFQMNESEESF